MWEYEYSLETSAGRRRRCGATGRTWRPGRSGTTASRRSTWTGPFEVGTTFTMTPPGDEPIRMRLVEIEPGTSFTDEMDAGDFVVRTEHRLEPAAGGLTRIVYRTQITGEAAGHVGPELGPQITADFPEVVAALAGRAEG